MFSRQVVIGRSRVFSAASGHFKFCESNNGSHLRYQNAKYVFKSTPTFMFARLASSSSAVPSEITKVIEKAAADSQTDTWPSLDELISSIGPLPAVPEPPAPPTPVPLEILANGEPSLASLGLGGYWPPGIFQQLLEFIHLHLDIPWWSSLILLTAVVRLCLFPVVVRQIKATTELAISMPAFTLLQQKMSAARGCNDYLTASRYALEMQEFWSKRKYGPLASVKFMILQGGVLISMTTGLRSMCNLPVESLQTGGLLHVLDLTAYDPTYMLPIACGLAIHTTLRLGTDFTVTTQSEAMKYLLLYGMPIMTTGFALYMQNFIVIYWIANSGIAIIQSRVIKSPRMREYFGIPKFTPTALPSAPGGKKKGVIESIKESMNNARVSRELQQRHIMDELTFERAGREPIRKTYKYNPKAAVSAKK